MPILVYEIQYALILCLHDFSLFRLQIFFQEIGCSQSEVKLPATAGSPIIDPHLSPDGSMLAYVKDYELHIQNLTSGEQKQLTFGARGNLKVIIFFISTVPVSSWIRMLIFIS